MNTTAAALQAHVTVATIRTWCRRGVIAATKAAGRWVIDTASLAHRIAIGAMRRQPIADLTNEYYDTVIDSAYHAADVRSAAGLKALLADVRARNITSIMGNIDPRRVRLTRAQWAELERRVSLQAGCVRAEH